MFRNRIKYKLGTSGFSLPGVLVGVGLLGISATIISQTVIDSRRTQKSAELKLSSNKFQQAALNAVTDRVKDFVLEERCSGARWGGAGTTEVEKAFSELPLTTESNVTTSLKFTKSPDLLTGNADVKGRCRAPVSLGTLDAGDYMRFCMEITPTGSPQVDYRLLELLIVPVDLASDKAIKCSDTSGAAAGIKVTWQMYNQINNSKVRGGATDKTVLTESGIFLVSAETQSYSGTCNITAARVGTSDQCTINVRGLGRRPPTLLKNTTVVTGFNWTRAPSTNYDAFTATTTCEKTLSSTFKAQSAAGSDACEAAPVTGVPPSCTVSAERKISNSERCDITITSTGGPISSGPSVTPTATPVTDWTAGVWEGDANCPGSSATLFSASVNGPGSALPVSCGTFDLPSLVITIPGVARDWIDTGVSFAGQTFRITVTGAMNLGSGHSGWQIGPVGKATDDLTCRHMASSAAGAALGKIGFSGTIFHVGSSYSSSTGTSGRLYLGHNDMVCYTDNSGSFTATISWP